MILINLLGTEEKYYKYKSMWPWSSSPKVNKDLKRDNKVD